MSGFKDMVARNNFGVFLNCEEFAEKRTVKYDGATYSDIPIVLSGMKEKDRRQLMSDHVQGLYLVSVVLHCALSDLGGAQPEKGQRIQVNDGEGGGISVVLGFRGNVIPLLKFDTKYGDGGRIATRVKRTSSAEMLESAFIAQVGGHRGVFEREGPARFPIRELFGPASPQMMYSNGDVLDDIEQKMADTYEKRIEHEILRVMNGWGG